MKVLKTYAQAEALEIIQTDETLQNEYEELKPYYEKAALDHGFKCGNFFSCEDFEDTQVVIQWCDDADDENFQSFETVVDSLEQLVVTLRDIENEKGNIKPN